MSDAATGAGDGTVGWTYSVANSATQYLAAGPDRDRELHRHDRRRQRRHGRPAGDGDRHRHQRRADHHALADASGRGDRGRGDPTLSDSGTIAFNDVDLIDVHTTSVAAAGSNTLGGTLTLVRSERRRPGPATARWAGPTAWPTAPRSTWRLGQTATESFTVTIDDGNGGTVDQLVTVTITGTNDAPTITRGDRRERRGDRGRASAER